MPPLPGGRPGQVALFRNVFPEVHDGRRRVRRADGRPRGPAHRPRHRHAEHDVPARGDRQLGVGRHGVRRRAGRARRRRPGRLPPLVPLGAPRGTLSPVGRRAPRRRRRDVVVAGATIDSVTSAVGTGARLASRCGLIIGTTSVVATHVASPRDRRGPRPVHRAQPAAATAGSSSPRTASAARRWTCSSTTSSTPTTASASPLPDDAFERVVDAAAGVPRRGQRRAVPAVAGRLDGARVRPPPARRVRQPRPDDDPRPTWPVPCSKVWRSTPAG